jgi:transcriptional regulator with XRE-family HTH domain
MESGQDREAVAVSLRRLRSSAGLSTYELAARLGWSQSKVSKMERGQTAADPEDVAIWARTAGADTGTVAELMARAEDAASQMHSWPMVLGKSLATRQREVAQINTASARHREFDQNLIGGLLQTPPYAMRVFELADLSGQRSSPAGRGMVTEAVAARMNRQAILYDPARSFEFVITEGALRFRMGPREVMHGQAEKIISVMQLPHVSVSVIPFTATPPALFLSAFVIYDLPDGAMVLIELVSREIQLRSTSDVRLYEQTFARLRESAVTGRAAEDLIRDAMIYE